MVLAVLTRGPGGGSSAPRAPQRPPVEAPWPPRPHHFGRAAYPAAAAGRADGPEREAWRELWASPVSVLWTSDDVPAVVRLIRLRARIDAEGVMSCPVSLFSQVGQLEDRFALNPRARRQAGIVVVATGAERKGRPLPNSRERERLLRG